MNSSALETVHAMYAAFAVGNLPAVLAPMHPEVDWRLNVDTAAPGAAGVPIFRGYRSPAEVAQFFGTLASEVVFHGFEPHDLVANEREVFACVRIELTVRRTGRRFSCESVHRFTFDDSGRLRAFREYTDTLALAAAWQCAA